MAQIDVQISELEQAIALGAMSVSYTGPGGNRTVTYRSVDEMQRILVSLYQRRDGVRTRDRVYLTSTRRGYHR